MSAYLLHFKFGLIKNAGNRTVEYDTDMHHQFCII